MFTAHGQQFATVAIARLVILLGWTHVPAAVDGRGGCTWTVEHAGFVGGDDGDGWPAEWMEWRADCGAELAYNDDRWVCAVGHEHVSAEARERVGWDYAEDAYDAAVITLGGREARPMGPGTFIDQREVAHAMAALR